MICGIEVDKIVREYTDQALQIQQQEKQPD